ncbi:UDP-glucuronosyltransferase 2A3-like isoform X2 [Toxorhynchites rutilus septentrionalis]|nr:UDP-glucuronosyltransferase 2A3-like isoform X2 [Toxorhynchites rutilus septentrionalis]
MNLFEAHISFFELEYFVCERAISSKGFQDLLNYPNGFQFHLTVHDHLAGPCLLTLLSQFNYPPLVLASAYNRLATTTTSLGSLVFPGFIPNQVNDIDGPMNFYQRVFNFLLAFWELLFKEFIYHPRLDALIKSQLNQTKSVSSLEKHTVLVILNSSPILEPPEPKHANIIQAGFLHIKSSKKLPQDLFDIVEKSTNGVILFSLGTNVRSDRLDTDILREIITAMGNLPLLTFLWKYEFDGLILPTNVVTSSWFPQNDLLSHPKLRLLITHGGLLSVQEAAWHGVPLIGMPIYGDQFGNVNQMVERGVARRLSLPELTAQQLQDCIGEMISTQSSYKENAMHLSKIVRDQQESPLDRATWSIEWILRNAETRDLWHRSLNSHGLLEKYSFDVVTLLVGCIATGSGLVLLLFNRCCLGVHKYKIE